MLGPRRPRACYRLVERLPEHTGVDDVAAQNAYPEGVSWVARIGRRPLTTGRGRPVSASTPNQPLVTVGIPTYNSALFLDATLRSALAQTYPELEVLVIDDASTDGTLSAARRFDDDRLRVVTSAENGGWVANHNRVLQQARGEFLKVLHADDLLAPDAVEHQMAALLAHPTAVLATSRRTIVDAAGRRLMSRGPKWPEGLRFGRDVVRGIVRSGRNQLGEPSAWLFRRKVGLAVGGFSAGWPYAVDVEFCVRLLSQGDLVFSPEELACFRISPGQVSAQVVGEQASDMARLFDRIRRDNDVGLTETDVRQGMRIVRRDAALRRLLYRLLSARPGSRHDPP